jgi:hypothetical protein
MTVPSPVRRTSGPDRKSHWTRTPFSGLSRKSAVDAFAFGHGLHRQTRGSSLLAAWIVWELELPILKKPFIRLVSTIALLLLLFAAVQAWSLSASIRGRFAARIDLRRGHYVFLTYGLEPPERREIARLLRERYGIELRTVAGDIVSKDLISYVSSYNEVMDATITRNFGHDVYKECAEAAYKIGNPNSRQ